jgi:Family of unknown function (DUF6286)
MSTSNPARVTVPPPRALPAAAWLGPLSALVLVAIGVVLGQEALSRWGVAGRSWLGVALEDVDGMRAGTWTVPAGVLLVVLGLLLLVATFKPRRRTHVPVAGEADLWMSPTALAALARDAAEGVPGVARVSVSASTTTVRLRAAAERPDAVAPAVEEAVTARLAGADVKISVRTHRFRPEGAPL